MISGIFPFSDFFSNSVMPKCCFEPEASFRQRPLFDDIRLHHDDLVAGPGSRSGLDTRSSPTPNDRASGMGILPMSEGLTQTHGQDARATAAFPMLSSIGSCAHIGIA